MLQLQMASAGSGKTYTLAKKYLWYFLTISEEGAPRRLRTPAELADSARHILAVTFTNKATNEMQERIVKNLFNLAYHEPFTDKKDAPDYLIDFAEALGVEHSQVEHTARLGIFTLLNNYSDFNVSTIDSFFQLVLRTFAYETDMNDSYQVELDGDFLSKVGIDSMLEDVNTGEAADDTKYWVREIMKRTDSKKWNIFQKKESSSKNQEYNPYSELIKALRRIENEDYKMVRKDVERFFESDVDFAEMYKTLSARYDKPVRDAFNAMRTAARKLFRIIPDEMSLAKGNSTNGRAAARMRRILNGKSGRYKWNVAPDPKNDPALPDGFLDRKDVEELFSSLPDGFELRKIVTEMHEAATRWKELVSDPEFSQWKIYSKNLPYFALFKEVVRRRSEYLREINAVELGETSMILKDVIGGSDTPFIYERLGTRLNHFLIDEFQDTSKLQWANMAPLLSESMARRNENLIIGDAKQSIYRFRNADPSLITQKVPDTFGSYVELHGNTREENRNWRSSLRVVQFNNSLFKYLARAINKKVGEDGVVPGINFEELYANVVQYPQKQDPADPKHDAEPKGYVEIHLFEDSKTKANDWAVAQVPELVCELLSRGYRQRDIAILVSTNAEGTSLINKFVEHNSAGGTEIRFVSEQSLRVDSSEAVKTVVDVLDAIARGGRPAINTDPEVRDKRGIGKWKDMAANFRFYAMGRDDLPMPELIEQFVEEGANMNRLHELLKGMQSVAVPALVEAVAASFLPDELRRKDAVFLAAFQDLVLEYCDGHPTDVASFLRWWERKSASAAIASPEDTDAVKVMTVHKSKGLEFPCVILPFANWAFSDSVANAKKVEWRWVAPVGIDFGEYEVPPYFPIETSTELRGSVHENLLTEFIDLRKMDALNSAYVAFTRAKKELYILAAAPKKQKDLIGNMLKRFIDELIATGSPDGGCEHISPEYIATDEETGIIRIGEPIQPQPQAVEEKGETAAVEGDKDKEKDKDKDKNKDKDKKGKVNLLDDYRCVAKPCFLKCREESLPTVVDADELDLEDTRDPRAEGNLMHRALEGVATVEDLPKSLKKMRMAGIVSSAEAREILSRLTVALTNPQVKPWFDGSAQVITERPLIKYRTPLYRPDRILIYPDGTAVVIDYKFGKVLKSKKYHRQVKSYMRKLSLTRQFREVKGFIWYVTENTIEPVAPLRNRHP